MGGWRREGRELSSLNIIYIHSTHEVCGEKGQSGRWLAESHTHCAAAQPSAAGRQTLG